MVHEGGCLCGAVRFRARGEPLNVRCCHCRQCQKAFSAPFHARAFFEQSAVELTGETTAWPTSDRIDRLSCTRCGTRVITWRKNGSGAGLPLAAFDDPNIFAPTDHVWVSEKLDWLKLDDGLPQYQEFPPP
jgi:hypothetical protein